MPAGGIEDADFVTARTLANDLKQWLDSIPEKFKITDMEELISLFQPDTPPMASLLPATNPLFNSFPEQPLSTIQSPKTPAVPPAIVIQRCEFRMIAQHCVTRLFLPRPRITGTNNSDRPPDKNARPGPQLSGLFGIEPALEVVQAGQVLHDTYLRNRCTQSTFYRVSFPRLVFDAAVVLAYIAVQQPLYTASTVLDAIQVALRLLRQFTTGSPDAADNNPSEMVMVVEKLLDKAKAAHQRSNPIASGMKRKHEEVDDGSSEGFRRDFRLPFSGAGVVNNEIPGTSPRESTMETEEVEFVPISSRRSDLSGYASSRARHSTASEPRTSSVWPPSSDGRQSISKHKHSLPQFSVRNRSGTSRTDVDTRSRAGSVSSRHSAHTAPTSIQLSVVPRPLHQAQQNDSPVPMYHGPTGPPQQFHPPENPPPPELSMTPSRPDNAYPVPPAMNYPQQFTPVQPSSTNPYEFYTPSSSFTRPPPQHPQTFEAMTSHTSHPGKNFSSLSRRYKVIDSPINLDMTASSGHSLPETAQDRHYRGSVDHPTVGMQPVHGPTTNAQPFHSHGLGLDQPLIQASPAPPPPTQSQPQHPDQTWPESAHAQMHGSQPQQHQQQAWDGTPYPYYT